MKGFLGVYLRELLLLKNRALKFILSLSVSPLLYILAFGLGLGKHLTIKGIPYLQFLIPGLLAGTTMMQAFSINVEINISRFYLKSFEEFRRAPISAGEYLLGEIATGITRAFISVIIILLLAYLSGVKLHLNVNFFLLLFLNSFFFASLGVICAMMIKSHADQTLITNFIITPMMFLSGTFFPVENLPPILRELIKYLPLTLVTKELRKVALGNEALPRDLAALSLLCLGIFLLGLKAVKHSRD